VDTGSPITVGRWCLFGLHDHAGHIRVVAARVLICSGSRGTTRFNASLGALFAYAMNTSSETIMSMPLLSPRHQSLKSTWDRLFRPVPSKNPFHDQSRDEEP